MIYYNLLKVEKWIELKKTREGGRGLKEVGEENVLNIKCIVNIVKILISYEAAGMKSVIIEIN